jgi:hypothetical protein
LLFGSGVEDPTGVIDQALLDAGFSSGQGAIGDQLAFWEGIQEELSAFQEWYSVATLVTVDSAYVLEEVYGAGAVSVPAEFLGSEAYDAIFLSNGFNEPTIGEDIDGLLASFTEGAEQGLSIDVSGILVDVFGAINSSVGSQDNYVNFLEQQLYGPNQIPGDGDGGLIEDNASLQASYNDLLTVAYGSDQTPFSEGGDGLDGLEGEIKDLESLIDGFVLYQDQLFDAAGLLNASINGTQASGGSAEYSALIQNADGTVTEKTETFTGNVGGSYGFPGAGYGELIGIFSSGQAGFDELQAEIAALNIEITNRTTVMNAVIDDYIGFALDAYNDDFRTDAEGTVTASVIAGILALLAERIPDQALLINMYSRLFNYVNTEGDVVDAPSQDNPLGVDFDEFVSTSGGGELNILNANPSTASGNIEALFLTALDRALEKILETVMSQNNETVTQSAYSLAQWYNAWNNIANNNTGAINPVTNYTEMQIGDFAGQVITPLQSEGIETFSQLITFLQQAEFNADQVKTIVNGFKYASDSGSNDHLFADITGDSTVATADLLSFLGAFGAGSNNAPFNVFARFDGQELGAGLPN